MSVVESTAFGAAWGDPVRAAAVLRARAASAGVQLAPAGQMPVVDLAAAVAAAHLWVVALGADSLSTAAQFPIPERSAAARVLARAAGHAPAAPAFEEVTARWAGHDVPLAPSTVHVAVRQVHQWLADVCPPGEARSAAAAAGDDLLSAGSPALAAAGAALLLEFEQPPR